MNTQKILLKFEPKKENILPAAKEIQKDAGFVSNEAVNKMANFFNSSPANIFSTISFYDQIKTKPPSDITIQVCDGANCMAKGAEDVIEQIELFFHQKAEDEFNPKVKIERVSCLGQCLSGPIIIVNENVFEKVTPEKVDDILRGYVGV